MGVKTIDDLLLHLDWFLEDSRFREEGLNHEMITYQTVREGRGGNKVHLVHIHMPGKTLSEALAKARKLELDLLNFGHGVRPSRLARVTVQVLFLPEDKRVT